MEFSHRPVLLRQCIEGLDIDPSGTYLDGTCGGAGHSLRIAEKLTDGRLIGIDRDPDAVKTASERLKGYNALVVKGNFSEVREISERLGISGYDGILLDLNNRFGFEHGYLMKITDSDEDDEDEE